MSWPDDNLPRFVVETVSGHRITGATGTSSSNRIRPYPISAYVLDRAYAHRVVASFERMHRSRRDVVAAAEAAAAVLNQREEQLNRRGAAA